MSRVRVARVRWFADHPYQRCRPVRRCRTEPGVRLPRLCHAGRTIGCTAVGRRHLRPDRSQQSGAGFARM